MSAASPADSQVPKRIGKYQILGQIGAGGMGAVYKARDLDLDRLVALKILPPELAGKPDMLERFRQEAKSAAKLRHDHIVTLYEINEADGVHYLAMEYVEGKNLLECIVLKVRFEPEEARKLMIQAARALALAHKEGIIHRDIKPSNFLLTLKEGKPFVKLTDFGLARTMDDREFNVTRLGTTVGTVDYISPEQARNSRAADIRSDIYSLGCTFYHMLAGRPPFPEGDMTERLLKHVEMTPDDVRKFNPKVPPGMVVVLSRMLAKRPEDRYQTPKELLQDLEHLPGGPILSPRELLEALALDSGEKPKTARRTSAETKKVSPAESPRLLGQPLEPSEARKLRYRHEKIREKKRWNPESEGGASSWIVIRGWKAWTAITGGIAAVIGITLALSFGLGTGAPERREIAQNTKEPTEPPKEESYAKSLERATEVNPNDRLVSSLPPSRRTEPDQPPKAVPNIAAKVQINRPKSFSPPVYQPTLEQLALLAKQFQINPAMPGELRIGQSPGQPPPKKDAAIGSTIAPKAGGADTLPATVPNPASGSQPVVVPGRPPAAILIVRRYPFGSDGKQFDSLRSACAAAVPNRDTIIEIEDNGPLFETAVAVAGRNLTLRAGKGFRPLLVWDTQSAAPGRLSQFFNFVHGNLTLDNLDVVVKVSDQGHAERISLFRIDSGDLKAQNCTFSVAGRHRGGTAVFRIDASGPEASPRRCRLNKCFVRGADAIALDLRAAPAEVTLDGCLLVSTNRAVVEVVGKAGATPTMVRAVHSTLVAGQSLFRVRPASMADKQPALHWLLWDSLLGRCGSQSGGDLLDLQDGAGITGMRWQPVNCLYSGWATLLKRETDSVNQLAIWRSLWSSGEGDKVAIETWPAVVPPDPSETPAAAFRVVGTHASFSDSTGTKTLGCDVADLPPARDNWLSITYERVPAPVVDLPAADQPPVIPDPGDGLYHGEQLDLTTVNLGDHLGSVQRKQKLGPKVVLRLRGKGEARTSPVQIKGASLVLYYEPAEEGEERLVLVPKGGSDRAALVEVEGGSCDIIGGKIRFPDSRNVPGPQHLVKVAGGHLHVVGSHLEGPTGQVPNSFRGLIHFTGSGEESADQAFECAVADSVLLSGLDGIHAVGAGTRVRVQNCVLVTGGEALHFEPGVGSSARCNVQCILEHNSITAQRALLRLGDAANLPTPVDPLVVQAKANIFVDFFSQMPRRSGMLAFDGAALPHGLLVWQGDGNVYDKQFAFYASQREQPPATAPQPYAQWTHLWGTAGDRRHLLLDPPSRALDWSDLQLERLALPESFRLKIKGTLPGADLEQLGIVKKPKKK